MKKTVSLSVGRGEKLCLLCGVDISCKRSDAKFCSREHKRITSDMKRDQVAEYQKNAEKRRSQALKYYYANHAQSKERQLVKQKTNPVKYAAAAAKHRAVKLQRTPAWLDEDFLWMIEQAYELSALRTKLFGFAWHVDHVIPLQGKYVSGLHVPTNLQVIPATENLRKANKHLPA